MAVSLPTKVGYTRLGKSGLKVSKVRESLPPFPGVNVEPNHER